MTDRDVRALDPATNGADQLLNLRNILLATDFSSCSAESIRYAISVAKHYHARLYVFHWLDPVVYNLVGPDALKIAFEWARRDLENLKKALLSKGPLNECPTEMILEQGSDICTILQPIVIERDIGLIVLGTHGRTGWKKLTLGSVAEKVFRDAACPVLTAGPCASRRRIQETAPQSILLVKDFSRQSRTAELYALSLAHRCKARLNVLHACDNHIDNTVTEDGKREWCNKLLADLGVRPEELVDRPEWVTSSGSRAASVLKTAESCAADLIVLTVSVPYRFVDRIVSTDAYQIVCGAPCPVLTVRSQQQRSVG
jgi:nucleotide-binding universal stress UspA family protein